MVHSGYHPHKPCPLRLVHGWCTDGYHPLKQPSLRLVFGWCTVAIILLNIVRLG